MEPFARRSQWKGHWSVVAMDHGLFCSFVLVILLKRPVVVNNSNYYGHWSAAASALMIM
jgi:hypothetical protein